MRTRVSFLSHRQERDKERGQLTLVEPVGLLGIFAAFAFEFGWNALPKLFVVERIEVLFYFFLIFTFSVFCPDVLSVEGLLSFGVEVGAQSFHGICGAVAERIEERRLVRV